VVEFPELLQAAEKKSRLRNPPKSEEAKFDAEIDRLCDLKALEKKKASKNTNRQGSKPDSSKGIQLILILFLNIHPRVNCSLLCLTQGSETQVVSEAA